MYFYLSYGGLNISLPDLEKQDYYTIHRLFERMKRQQEAEKEAATKTK